METNWSEVGGRIKKLRKVKHLSTEKMATELNFSERHYKRLESGSTVPTTSFLISISEYFNVPIDFIVFGNKKSSSPEAIEQLIYKFNNLNRQGKQILLSLADELNAYAKQIKVESKLNDGTHK